MSRCISQVARPSGGSPACTDAYSPSPSRRRSPPARAPVIRSPPMPPAIPPRSRARPRARPSRFLPALVHRPDGHRANYSATSGPWAPGAEPHGASPRSPAWSIDPSWSSDHQRIAFTRAQRRPGHLPDERRWDRQALGPLRDLPGHIDMPSWSPDGTHLLVRVVTQGYPYLAKIDLATGNMACGAVGALAVAGDYPIYDPTGKTSITVDNHQRAIKRFTPGGAVTTVLTSSGPYRRSGDLAGRHQARLPAAVTGNNARSSC